MRVVPVCCIVHCLQESPWPCTVSQWGIPVRWGPVVHQHLPINVYFCWTNSHVSTPSNPTQTKTETIGFSSRGKEGNKIFLFSVLASEGSESSRNTNIGFIWFIAFYKIQKDVLRISRKYFVIKLIGDKYWRGDATHFIITRSYEMGWFVTAT